MKDKRTILVSGAPSSEMGKYDFSYYTNQPDILPFGARLVVGASPDEIVTVYPHPKVEQADNVKIANRKARRRNAARNRRSRP